MLRTLAAAALLAAAWGPGARRAHAHPGHGPARATPEQDERDEPGEREGDAEGTAPPRPAANPPSIVVEAERHDTAADPTANRTVIEGDTLRRAPAPTLLEAVAAHTPGLHTTTTGTGLLGVGPGSMGGITLRGLGGSPTTGVLTVLDGVPVMQGLFGHPVPDFLTPGAVQQVAVTPGGDSVRYGSGALGGVIRLDSRWRDEPGTGVRGQVGLGAFQTVRARGGLWSRRGAWDGLASVDLLQTAGPREGAGGQRWSAQTAGRWRGPGGLTLVARAWGGRIRSADPGHIDRPTPEAGVVADRAGVSAGLTRPLGPGTLRVRAWSTGGVHRFADRSRVRDLTAGAYAEQEQPLVKGLRVIAGVWADARAGQWRRSEGGTQRIPTEESLAAYGELQVTPHERLTLLGGARVAWLDGRDLRVPFKAGLRWAPHPDWHVRLRHADNVRVPTLAERYLPLPVANPALPPEAASVSELAIGWVRPSAQLGVAGFRTVGRDGIRVFGVPPYAERVAIDRVEVLGLEAEGAVRPLSWLEAQGQLTVHAPGRFTRQLPSRLATVRLRIVDERADLGLSARHLGGLYAANYQREALPDLWDVSARASWTLPGRPLRLTLIARNLLDRANATLPGYPSAPRHAELRIDAWTASTAGP
jgi:outer membrane receptor protein involved in Fe transport